MFPVAKIRRDRLSRCIKLLSLHAEDIAAAVNADFGMRSRHLTLLTDVASSIASLKHAHDHVDEWVRPNRRKVELMLAALGARAEVQFQPKGVVGVIAPWNFPVNLVFAPLAGVLAAGNRVMIKPSEHTPQTSELLAQLIGLFFDETEIAVASGGAELGAAFAALPFDHLVFTGGAHVGRQVMRAAAENLTPVTLELGGKSPVILAPSADMPKATARIMAGKLMNAGQICLAPDYVLVRADQRDQFVEAAKFAVRQMYPSLGDNPDYASMINFSHRDRIAGLVEDARARGAKIVDLNPAGEDFSRLPHNKAAPVLVLNPTDDMTVMQNEIFGPILPVLTYTRIEDAIDYVNARPRPLALYAFGENPEETGLIVGATISGGAAVNDVVMHVSVEGLPFGGIGPSGMGAYHGHDGFLEFSHRRAVFRQTGSDLINLFRPPYGETFKKFLERRLKG
ncbi:MAG: coniferyl aldehyde dehydrogenase [Caulobacterales bacterium]